MLKKAILLVGLALSLALTGCPLTPILNETTPPNLYFTVWYEKAAHDSNSDEMGPIAAFALDAHKCIYVASPFLVRVMASDPGGVAVLDVANQGNNSLRVLDAQTLASPAPGSPTQSDPVLGGNFSNPGSPFGPGANASTLTYYYPDTRTGGPVYNVATLEVAFEFVPKQPATGTLLVEARNASDQVSRIVDYKVMQAGDSSGQQPGQPCAASARAR